MNTAIRRTITIIIVDAWTLWLDHASSPAVAKEYSQVDVEGAEHGATLVGIMHRADTSIATSSIRPNPPASETEAAP